jgi:hypothetical protein
MDQRESNRKTEKKLGASQSVLFTKYCCGDQMKENVMGGASSMHRGGLVRNSGR